MIHVRPYQPEDLIVMTELMKDLGYPTTEEQMRNRMSVIETLSGTFTFLADLNGKAVGMMGIRHVYSYEEDGFVIQISLLVTKKEYEGQGIGKALVSFAESWAVAQDAEILYLTSGIKPERERAHAFYKAIGFEATGYRFVKRLTIQ
ncbi:GNAT family N-acetyltransferase [Paenibacillus sp. LHD-38]|uniref:GNAT family N-acetyltransferase n=1 Tax=Paenibacillus sp. LHD-38 TaxID=3072143 RepID=UPI00280D61F9|nr:GNAT family N-acetyltransferase [Paenibacillus sp. LHD-38]MDQ8735322.1 GNAT family N-acetyltransferase [Paenibacillus sp. LHD-38]